MSIYITKLNENVVQMAKSDKAVLVITRDFDPDSPRNWDNLGMMICGHKKYALGDKHNYNIGDYAGWRELEGAIYKDEDIAICLPLYLYDHSGITISTSSSYPYNDRWDAGQVGFIIATKSDVRECYGIKRITKEYFKKAREVLLGEIEVYDQYLRGEVYGFIIETPNGDHIDSCSGFYGDDFEANGMADHIGDEYKDLLKALEYV